MKKKYITPASSVYRIQMPLGILGISKETLEPGAHYGLNDETIRDFDVTGGGKENIDNGDDGDTYVPIN